MRLWIALRAFFAVLFDKAMADQIRRVLAGEAAIAAPREQPAAELPGPTASQAPAVPAAPARSPAVTLLAALQREARLVDLIQEDLSQYSDAQVGAASRPCLQQCASVLKRLFELQPVVNAAEGEMVEVGEKASPIRYQWVGEGAAASGKLVHHGWEATKIELPGWTGEKSDANIVAPAKVQVP